MAEPEETVLAAMRVVTTGLTKTYYNLYLTNSRLVVIHLGLGLTLESVRGKLAGMTLDQVVATDRRNFAWPYSYLEKVILHTSIWKKVLEVKAGQGKYEFYLGLAELGQLKSLLPTIPGLTGKLEMA